MKTINLFLTLIYISCLQVVAQTSIQTNTQTIPITDHKTDTHKVAKNPKISEDEAHNFLKASHFQQQQMYSEALLHFNKITEIAPTNHVYHYEKGTTLIHLSNFDEAHDCFRNTLSLKHDYANAHLMLGFLYAKQGKINEALEAYHQAFIYEENIANKLSYKLVMITLLDNVNKLAQAQKHITEALALNIPDELLLFYQGKLQNINENYEAAYTTLSKSVSMLENIERDAKISSSSRTTSISKKPKSANNEQISHNLVTLHHKHSMVEDDAKYYFELYKANFYTKRYSEAKKIFKKAYFDPFKRQLDEMDINYLYNVALAYHKVYQFAKSKAVLNKIITLSPNFTTAHRLNATIKDDESDKTVYITQLKKSLNYVRDNPTKEKMLKLLLPLEMCKGNYEGVIATANEILKLRNNDHNTLFMKAIALDKLNKDAEAIVILQKVVSFHNLGIEKYAMYYFQLGLIGEKVHNNTLALSSYQKSNYFYFKQAAQYELSR